MSPVQRYKILWLPDSRTGLYDMRLGQELEPAHPVYERFTSNYLPLDRWLAAYSGYYRLWLDDTDDSIYQPRHPLLRRPIEAAQQFNRESAAVQLYYWFDFDHSRLDITDFSWRVSPLSGELLTNLGPDFSWLNRLVALRDALVMPDVMSAEELLRNGLL